LLPLRRRDHTRELAYEPSDPRQDHRGLDATHPIFAMFDFTPEERGDWHTKLSYR
jgi:predicted dithiol-disulfide oxidoreductase (DUF899 family)